MQPAGSAVERKSRRLIGLWALAATGLAAATLALTLASAAFAPPAPANAMPILPFALCYLAAGVAFLAMLPLIRASERLGRADQRRLVIAIAILGIVLRLLLLASEPVLEVDFNRYLWEGALTAHGLSPYALAPARISGLAYDDLRLELSKAAGPVFDAISYPELTSVYPPVAQAAFALAHLIDPWELWAWRLVALGGEAATFLLLLALLAALGRSPLWVALYWWSPLALKEIANSAHMEAVLLPLVLAGLLLAAHRRPVSAAGMIGLAAGAKLWPILLLPIVLRPLAGRPRALAGALALLIGIGVAIAAPIASAGLELSSGFIGFATHWTTNSAHFPVLEALLRMLMHRYDAADPIAGTIGRLLLAAAVCASALALAWRPLAGAGDLVGRAGLVITLIVLASPAQFPWYVLWALPLATLRGGIGWHVAAAVMPLYYTAFHLIVAGRYDLFSGVVVWLIWVPTWLALASDAIARRR
jgi:hypothetical protein